ncbi:MAG: hypothetical protein AAFP69_11090, partial [Planctomycetota bacterium]
THSFPTRLSYDLLNCYKPIGWTSRDVVNVVASRVRPAKAGHAGTLDPLADGVLLVAIGPVVRYVQWMQQQPKTYLATFRLGQETPSADLEFSPTVHRAHPRPTLGQLNAACTLQIGEIDQTPPVYSAVKINGRRATFGSGGRIIHCTQSSRENRFSAGAALRIPGG